MSLNNDMGWCPDCGAKVGELHQPGCDVERCRLCGGQAISCDCVYELAGQPDDCEDTHPDVYNNGPTEAMEAAYDAAVEAVGGYLPWTGEWPGVAECREFGWYSYFVPNGNPSWRRCNADHPGATEDLNRLATGEAVWDVEAGRFILPTIP